MRILFPMRSMFPRGAEKCNLYLLQALKRMPVLARVPVFRHNTVPPKDAYYLIKDFCQATEVSMKPDDISWPDFLLAEVDIFQPDLVVFLADPAIPENLHGVKLAMIAQGLNENDFSCYRDSVSAVICVSQAAVPYAIRSGIPEEKIVVIRNGVAMPSMGETPLRFNFIPTAL